MAFKTRKIRKKPPFRPLKKLKKFFSWLISALRKITRRQRSYALGAILITLGIVVVVRVTFGAYRLISGFDPKELIFAIGSELEQDENGYTNIVLLGDGGHLRDGADLIDTIMVASIDYRKNAVSLLSIPRDYYVDSENIQWSGRINELYRNHKFQIEDEDERYELFQTVAEEITNLDIQYYLRVNFNAFVEIVNSIGGIDVDVQENLYDPYYPNETDNGYVTFQVEKGLQFMDGETALKFVRSRKTTSDFDRAARQQLVLSAIREKALSSKTLTSASKLKKIYAAVDKNMDTNMNLREMIALGKFGVNFDRNNLISKVIHDDPGQDGGFLYTPERELYNGQFVLIPFTDSFSLLHRYADLIFKKREAFFDPVRIEILNGTKTAGIARNTAYQLNRYGFDVVKIDNYFDNTGEKKFLDKTTIFYYDWEEEKDGIVIPTYQTTIDGLKLLVQAEALPDPSAIFFKEREKETKGEQVAPSYPIGLSIVLGEDYEGILP